MTYRRGSKQSTILNKTKNSFTHCCCSEVRCFDAHNNTDDHHDDDDDGDCSVGDDNTFAHFSSLLKACLAESDNGKLCFKSDE